MAIKYEPLPTVSLAYAECAHPPAVPEVLHMEDNALCGMVDFKFFEPNIILEDERMEAIIQSTTKNPQHYSLVTDFSHHVIGILRSEDVQGTIPYQIMEEKGVKREKIRAKSLMIPHKEVLTFDLDDLKNVRIGNVIVTMQKAKKHFALVQETDPKNDKTVIRGLYALAVLMRALGDDI